MNEFTGLPQVEVDYNLREKLKFTFGEKANISKESKSGRLRITTTLENGIVAGGQKVELELIEDFDGKNVIDMPVSYLISSMKVNGFEKITNEDKTIFYPYTDEEIKDEEEVVKSFEERFPGREDVRAYVNFHQHISFTEGSQQGSGIIIRGLRSSDHLAIYYHEKGHKSDVGKVYGYYDQGYRQEFEKQLSERSALSKDEADDIDWTSFGAQIYLQNALVFVREEARADNNAIRMINEERNKGEDPFPGDDEDWQVKKLFQTGLLTSLREDRPLLKKLSSELNKEVQM